MKKIHLYSAILPCLAAILFSCSDVSEGGNSMSYSYLTENRGFIGGSLIWNPDKGASQLRAGTKVGIRLGKLKEISGCYKVGEASDEELTLTEADFDGSTFTTSSDGSFTTSFLTKVSSGDNIKNYEDEPSKAEYGYLSINSIDGESVSLTYTKVNSDDTSSSKNFTIKKGKECDLNGDGNPDLKYGEPDIQRTNYKGARWLTFVNDDDKPSSSMYFTFTAAAERAGYRASTDSAELVEQGLYGVNSNGDFIYISTSARPDSNLWQDAAHGDYIICTEPFEENWNSVTYEESSSYAVDYDPNSDPSFFTAQDSYDESDLVKFTRVEQQDYNACYVVTKNTSTNFDNDLDIVDRPTFAGTSYGPDYHYVSYQFPDQVDGPFFLICELTDDAPVKKAFLEANGKVESDPLPMESAVCIDYLNKALTNEAFFNAVVDTKLTSDNVYGYEVDASARAFCKEQWQKADTDDKKRRYVRTLLDDLYDFSPEAAISAPCLENVYPVMIANVGSVSELEQSVLRYADVYTEVEDSSSRAITSKWDEFEPKRKAIREEVKKYKVIDLVGLVGSPYDLAKAGIKMGLGVKGSVTNPSGQFRVDMGFAVYMDFDLSLQSALMAIADKEAGAPANAKMNDMLKKLFDGKKNCDIKKTDIELQVGPIPLVFGLSFKTGINFNLGALNPHICFVGLYGADAYVDIRYGMKKAWFIPYPYVSSDIGGKGIASTEMFLGVEGSGPEESKIVFEPWISIVPSAGVGKSWVSVRASLPITLGTEFTFGLKDTAPSIDKLALTIKVNFMPYAEVNKLIKFRLTLCNKPIMSNALVLFPEIKWENR